MKLEYNTECLLCSKLLRNYGNPKNSSNQPSGGLAFEAVGHYGSTVFDPFDGSKLHLSLCDSCVLAGLDNGRINCEGNLDG